MHTPYILKWLYSSRSTFVLIKWATSWQNQQNDRLIWVFAGHTCHFVGFVMRRFIIIETSSPKGNDRSPESNVPRPICPKTLCSLSPTPMMQHIIFDPDWPTGSRDIQVQKCDIFVTQGQVTPKLVVWFGPKANWAFIPVLVTCNFDDDSIKNKQASMETPFSHCKSMGNFFRPSRAAYSISQWSDLAEIRTRPRFYARPHYLQV